MKLGAYYTEQDSLYSDDLMPKLYNGRFGVSDPELVEMLLN